MLQELEPKRQRQALQGGFRRTAAIVRRAAVANMKASGLHTNAEMIRSIRTVVYRKICGFKVTVGTKKISQSRLSKLDDKSAKRLQRMRLVPLWAEGGTKRRTTKGGFLRKGKNRGSMPAYEFMKKTENEMKGEIDRLLKMEIEKNVEKTVKKYGSDLK